jgi:hypothetical protein
MIHRKTKGRTRSAIVSSQGEACEPQLRHDLYLVLGHTSKRIVAAIREPNRLATVSIASQIGSHNSEVFSQPRRNTIPAHLGEWIAVQ